LGVGRDVWLGEDLSVAGDTVHNGTTKLVGITTVTNVTNSSNTASGAFQVAGGVGIGGNLHVGGNIFGIGSISGVVTTATSISVTNDQSSATPLYIAGVSTSSGYNTATVVAGWGPYVVPNSGRLFVNTATNATSTSTGALTVRGGASIGIDLWVGDNLRVTNGTNIAGVTTVTNVTNPTSTATGALQVAGGAGIGRDIWVGGTARIAGITTVTNVTNATSTATGALQVAGGAGIGRDLWVGGAVDIDGAVDIGGTARIVGITTVTNVTNATSTNSGALQVAGGLGIGQDIWIGGTARIAGITTVTNVTNATSTNSGALQVVGGLGVGRDVWLGEDLSVAGDTVHNGTTKLVGITTVTNVTNASNTASGAFQVAGGAGIGRDLWVGANIYSLNSIELRNATTTTVSMASLQTQGSTVVFEFGRTDMPNNPAIDFHSSGANTDYDVRIQAIGGNTATIGQARLDIIANQVYLSSTQTATSTQTGALRVTGGVGIGQDLYVGGNIYGSGSISAIASTASTISITNNQASTTPFYLTAVTTSSGAHTATVVAGWGPFVIPNTGRLVLNTNTNVTSTSTGALTTPGGASFGRDVWIAGGTRISSVSTLSDVTNATSTITGALQVAGGVGIGRDVWIGEDLSVGGDVVVGRTIKITGITTVTNVTNATSTITGALQVAGGLGVGRDVWIDGVMTITNTTAASSTVTGALKVAGGVGIQGDLYARNIYSNGAIVGTNADKITIANNQTSSTQYYLVSVTTSSGAQTATVVAGWGPIVIPATGQVIINTNTNATSTITGALRVVGGAGIQRDLFVGGTLYVNGAAFTGTQAVSYQEFTAIAAQTTFTVSGGYTVGQIDVFANGVLMNSADYTATNGTTVVFGSGRKVNDLVRVKKYITFSVADTVPASGGTITGNLNVTGTLSEAGSAVATRAFSVAMGIALG
jgi:acetyltransferase-like isoleucine patch superfamily enzyme